MYNNKDNYLKCINKLPYIDQGAIAIIGHGHLSLKNIGFNIEYYKCDMTSARACCAPPIWEWIKVQGL